MSTKARLFWLILVMSITLFASPLLAQADVEYPVVIDTFLTVVGVAIFAGVFTQWLKHLVGDWRWTQLLVLLISIMLAMLAVMIRHAWHPDAAAIWEALMTAFFGASVTTFGYETALNIRGALGKGSRSDEALLTKAEAMVEKHNK